MLIATGALGMATAAQATTMSEPLDTADFSSNPVFPDSLPAGTDLVNGLLDGGDMLDAFRFSGLTPGDLRTFDWTLNAQPGASITILFLNSAFTVLGASNTSGTLNVIVPVDGIVTVWAGLEQASQGGSSYSVSLQAALASRKNDSWALEQSKFNFHLRQLATHSKCAGVARRLGASGERKNTFTSSSEPKKPTKHVCNARGLRRRGEKSRGRS